MPYFYTIECRVSMTRSSTNISFHSPTAFGARRRYHHGRNYTRALCFKGKHSGGSVGTNGTSSMSFGKRDRWAVRLLGKNTMCGVSAEFPLGFDSELSADPAAKRWLCDAFEFRETAHLVGDLFRAGVGSIIPSAMAKKPRSAQRTIRVEVGGGFSSTRRLMLLGKVLLPDDSP